VTARMRLVALVLSLVACSSSRLPPGTLPPEYEPPRLAPWNAAVETDAGVAGSGAVTDAGLGKASAGPLLSPDAGVR
jgi:hypothetical protein